MTDLPLSRPLLEIAKTVAGMVEDTLLLGADEDLAPFWVLAVVLRSKLPPWARRGLAWAALMACDDDEAQAIAEAVLGSPEGAGWPHAPFDGVMDQALFWADLASREELRSYGFACLAQLSSEERLAIWRALEGRAAA